MESAMKKRGLSARDLCFIGLFVAVIAVCAQISIPFLGGIPFTLQTWAVALAGVILGARKGTIAVIVYVLIGAVGVPVFTQFRGGIGVITGVTGGFIVSFPVQAFMAGIFSRKNIPLLVLGLVIGTAINLTAGMHWFAFVSQGTIQAAFAAAVAPFILPEIIKIVVVILLGKSIQTALAKAQIHDII
ncbi:MAG: biotin transporter BioY [Defluviitaleaceae bacterium]|nr:biotin transporter BioY [Defluviitaleaceae bacterium]